MGAEKDAVLATPTGSTLTHLECTDCGQTCGPDVLRGLCAKYGKALCWRSDLANVSLCPHTTSKGAYPPCGGIARSCRSATRRTSSASAKASPRCWPRRGSPPSSASPTCASRTEPRTRPAVSKRGAWWLRFPRARELGAKVVAAPSAGNAGGALAGYAARPAGPDEAPGGRGDFEQLDVLAANPSSRCTDPDGVKGERHQVSRSFNRNWCWETGRPQFQLKLLSAEVSSTCPQVPRVVSCGFRHGATG